ncbi:MAG: hypothetical protein ACU0B9_13840 [Limimaricola soesokkakensis]|uniref:hypothetical protein n=1 Tax=Limimaricola soesokkakensis TaxID=1343159 RepID=UPI00405832A2
MIYVKRPRRRSDPTSVDIYRFVNDRLAGDGMTLFICWSHNWRFPSLFMNAGPGSGILPLTAIGGSQE